MMCTCKVCGNVFDANPRWHHPTGLCGDACRIEARRQAKAKYKNTEKGQASEARWRANPAKKEIDKRSMQTPTARAMAVIRSRRNLANNPYLQERKRERDKAFGKTVHGREINRAATRRYSQTERGRIYSRIDKARRGAIGSFTPEEWLARLAEYDGRCAGCGATENIEVDHIIPISRGGTNDIENIQPLCRRCNASKGDRLCAVPAAMSLSL